MRWREKSYPNYVLTLALHKLTQIKKTLHIQVEEISQDASFLHEQSQSSHPSCCSIQSLRQIRLNVLDNKVTIDKLSVGSNRPNKASEDETGSQRHIDDDLLHGWLLVIAYSNKVAPSDPPDPSSDVQEQQAGRDELTPVPLIAAHYQMRQPIGAAEQAVLAVVVEPSLGFLDGGFDGESRCAIGGVKLQRGFQLLDLLLLALGELLGLFARSEPRNVRNSREWSRKKDGRKSESR